MRAFTKLNNLERRLEISKYYSSSFHSSLRCTLICSRFIGLLPLSGLSNPNSDELRFSLKSPYTVLYIISLFGQCLIFLMTFYWVIQKGISLSNITNSIFCTSSLISLMLLLQMGRYWPQVTAKVEEIENTLPPFRRNVPRYCNITMLFVISSAVVEHLLSIFYGFTVAYSCDKNNVAEIYFRSSMPWLFDYTTYSLWKGILSEIFNIQSTFIWSFNDLLLMTLSIYLTEHFIEHNKLLEKAIKNEFFKAKVFREQHLNIIRLVHLINGQTGIYILNSFASNLYWICTQLFFSLNKTQTGHYIACHEYEAINGIEHTIYFTYSFSFIVVRTCLVLLLAARIHSNSVAPRLTLYGLKSEHFDVEAERFISQINNIKVALSGLDFFYVTRTMILTLMGTIITYELVLLQFNK